MKLSQGVKLATFPLQGKLRNRAATVQGASSARRHEIFPGISRPTRTPAVPRPGPGPGKSPGPSV